MSKQNFNCDETPDTYRGEANVPCDPYQKVSRWGNEATLHFHCRNPCRVGSVQGHFSYLSPRSFWRAKHKQCGRRRLIISSSWRAEKEREQCTFISTGDSWGGCDSAQSSSREMKHNLRILGLTESGCLKRVDFLGSHPYGTSWETLKVHKIHLQRVHGADFGSIPFPYWGLPIMDSIFVVLQG